MPLFSSSAPDSVKPSYATSAHTSIGPICPTDFSACARVHAPSVFQEIPLSGGFHTSSGIRQPFLALPTRSFPLPPAASGPHPRHFFFRAKHDPDLRILKLRDAFRENIHAQHKTLVLESVPQLFQEKSP